MARRRVLRFAGWAGWAASCLLAACSGTPATAVGRGPATSGSEDLSMTAHARRVHGRPIVASPAAAPRAEVAPSQSSVPNLVPKLVAVAPQTGPTDAGPSLGPTDRDTGTPLPPRPAPPENAGAAYAEGVRAMQAGQLELAKQAFSRAVADDTRPFRALYALGVVADRQGQTDEALKNYAQALQVQPDYEEAAQGTVNILLRRGTPDAAVRFVEPLARQWQRNLSLQTLYADTLVRVDRVDEAEQVARAALKRDERFVPAIVVLAEASLRRGRDELADSTLAQAKEIDPGFAKVYFLQGKRAQSKGELMQAITAYRNAVTINPDYAEARTALGIQAMSSGNYAEARDQFEAVVRLAPTLTAPHLNLGDAYRALRRWQDAKRELDKALRMEARLPEAHYNMALLYMTVGNEFPNLSELDALNRALTEFGTYRAQQGARLVSSDPSGAYIADVQRRIDREKKRIDREKAKAASDAQRKAREVSPGTGP